METAARNWKGSSIDDALRTQPNAPDVTSRGRAWRSLTVDLHPAVAQMDLVCPARDHHVLFYNIGESSPTIQKRAGKTHISILLPGSVVLMPAGYESTWQGSGPASAKIRIPTHTIDTAAAEMGIGAARVRELLNVFDTRDPTIERLAAVLCTELESAAHPAQSLLVESVACALAAQLIRRYDTSPVKFERAPSGLAPQVLQRVLEYVNDHLGASIELADLAALANVSRFHFSVLFKRSVGLSPKAYVEQSRIKRAQAMIRAGKLPLAEIGLAMGYADQSHFIRRFARHTGCTPGAYAFNFGLRKPPRASTRH